MMFVYDCLFLPSSYQKRAEERVDNEYKHIFQNTKMFHQRMELYRSKLLLNKLT